MDYKRNWVTRLDLIFHVNRDRATSKEVEENHKIIVEYDFWKRLKR